MTEKNRIDTRQDPKRLTLVPHGHLGAKMVQDRWTSVQKDIESLRPPRIVVDGSDVTGCDGVGIAFLLDIQQQQDRLGGAFSMEGFPQDLLELIQSNSIECDIQQPPKTQWLRAVFQDIGCEGYSVISGLHSQIAFLGELLYLLPMLIIPDNMPVSAGNRSGARESQTK